MLINEKRIEDFNGINTICKNYGIENYLINQDGSVDVDGDVLLFHRRLINIPLKFGRVSGNFNVNRNGLISLEGSPDYVGGYFSCAGNKLISLDFCPSYVGGEFDCEENELITLNGAPGYVGKDFYCSHNVLTSLKGISKEIGKFFHVSGNPLPQAILDNMTNIDYILSNQEDYGIWRADGTFNEIRFNIMMREKNI